MNKKFKNWVVGTIFWMFFYLFFASLMACFASIILFTNQFLFWITWTLALITGISIFGMMAFEKQLMEEKEK